MVFIVKKLLHVAQACLRRYMRRVWCALNRYPRHQYMQVCTLHMFLTSMYVFATQSLAVCAHALVYAQFFNSCWGTKVGRSS